MNGMNKDTLNHYYDLLEETMKENNLLDFPTKLYNFDETGIPLDPKIPKVKAIKGMKNVRYQNTGRKGQITVVAYGNAAGHVLPTLIIFDAKTSGKGGQRMRYQVQSMLRVIMDGSMLTFMKAGYTNFSYPTQIKIILCFYY